jgi:hypothetical protein
MSSYYTRNRSTAGIFGIEHPDYEVITPRAPRRRVGSAPAWKSDPASESQLNFIANLMRDRVVADLKRASLELELGRGITKGRAGEIIDELKLADDNREVASGSTAAPARRTEAAPVGVYELDGEYYAIREAKDTVTKQLYRYARHIVITQKNDEDYRVDFEAAKGMQYRVEDGRALTLAEVEELSLEFSRCFLCGIELNVIASKKAGVGPVCRKKLQAREAMVIG